YRAPEPAPTRPDVLSRFFTWIVARRWLIVAFYALVLPPSAYFATKVGQDNDIQRLMVPDDPDFVATRAFQQVFGAGEFAVLLAEAPAPFAPAVIERLDRMERGLAAIPRVQESSALSVYRRAKGGFTTAPADLAAFKKFATGTDLFRKQGLEGDHFLAIALILDVKSTDDRGVLLGAVEKVVA